MATTYECGICWTVYDPALGDNVAQIAQGTAFADLPDDWQCPNCAAAKQRFLAVEGARAPRPAVALRSPEQIATAVRTAYLAADETMRGLPVHNPRLGFDAIGFRRFDGAYVGVAVTPWCMTILRLPIGDVPPGAPGDTVLHTFPSGEYEFVVGTLDGIGVVETSSLFSPMQDFGDPASARATAEAAIAALFRADEVQIPQPAAAAAPSRRALLFGSSS